MLDGAKLVGVTAMSNVLGTINPVRQLADAAHAAGAVVLVDAAQYVPHVPTLVDDLGADFLGFTGHKMLGPTGIGVLWGREELLDAMPPFLGGGEMIRDVRLDGFTPNELPWKFEAGTPPIAEAIGLGAAVDYLESLGHGRASGTTRSSSPPTPCGRSPSGSATTSRIHGPPEPAMRGGVLSFAFKDLHPHDISQVLDQSGVCVRAGHHCAKPLMRRLGVGATARASFYVYNDEADVDALADAPAVRVRLLRPVAPGERRRCPASKTSTARSSSTTTATRGTGASCRRRRPRGSRGSTRCAATRSWCYLDVDDGRIADVKIGGQGCSISQSSASMMSAAVKGKTVDEARELTRAFKAMMSIHESKLEGDGDDAEPVTDPAQPGAQLGDLEALQGVVKFPVRIKCATLSWNTLTQGLDEAALVPPVTADSLPGRSSAGTPKVPPTRGDDHG